MSLNFYIRLSAFLLVVAVGVYFYKTSLSGSWLFDTAIFGDVSLKIEYAITEGEREKGLGGRESIKSDYGMLFVFPKDDIYSFWMKDTLVPLDIFWLDSKGQVVHIAPDVATSTYPNVFYPTVPARYVLETVAGFARENNIIIGTQLQLKKFPIVSK